MWVAEQAGDFGFRKLVAVKMIRSEMATDPTFRTMFLKEAQLASRLRHANVVEVLDLGDEQGIIYQVMTLIDGASLAALQRRVAFLRSHGRGPMPLGIALRIACDVLRGLHAAHVLADDDGSPLHLVHRDVSPENVLVGVDGVAKLADFGIARALGGISNVTQDNSVRGKHRYIAPEQLEGAPASIQSDLFSAGVVLWELLVGRGLFAAPTKEEELRRRTEAITDPRAIDPRIPASVAAVTLRALARQPEARFSSARAMIDALEAAVPVATHEGVATFLDEQLGAALAKQREMVRRTHHDESAFELVPELRSSAVVDALQFAPTVTGELLHDDATTTVAIADGPPVQPPRSSPSKARSGRVALGASAAFATALLVAGFAYVHFGTSAEKDDTAPVPIPVASVTSDERPIETRVDDEHAPPAADSVPAVASSRPSPNVSLKPRPRPRAPAAPQVHAAPPNDPGARF